MLRDAGPAPEAVQTWSDQIDAVLYGVLFRRALDDDAVEGVAGMIEREHGAGGPQIFVRSIAAALEHPGDLNTHIGAPHSEADIRVFLGRLSARLESGLIFISMMDDGQPASA